MALSKASFCSRLTRSASSFSCLFFAANSFFSRFFSSRLALLAAAAFMSILLRTMLRIINFTAVDLDSHSAIALLIATSVLNLERSRIHSCVAGLQCKAARLC